MISKINVSWLRVATLATVILSLMTTTCPALDTDIYATNPRPNVMILFDTSGSMGIGVYEYTYDYKTIYKNACESTEFTAYDYKNTDSGGTSNPNYKRYIDTESASYKGLDPNEIVLIRGKVHVSVRTKDDEPITMTGDSGDYRIDWVFDGIEKTGAYLDGETLVPSPPATPILTLHGEDQEIYLGGSPLPLDRSITLHDIKTYADNTTVDQGFVGRIQAPGYHYTGYSLLTPPTVSEDHDDYVWFLASGNWVYFKMAHTLYDDNDTYYHTNDYYRLQREQILGQHSIPLEEIEWNPVNREPILSHSGYTAQNGNSYYSNNTHEIRGTINQPDAKQIKLHFTVLDMETKPSNGYYDYLIIKDNNTGNIIDPHLYENRRLNFYSPVYNSSNISVIFHSDQGVTDDGFKIDSYSYNKKSADDTTYTMRTRIDVVRDAIKYIVDDTKGTINWALMSFNSGNGAKVDQGFVNTALVNDDTVITNIKNKLDNFVADGGTPLGESLQDVFKHFHDKVGYFSDCSCQYTIVISDGFPSSDTYWSRISGITFTDSDGDGWTADPVQSTNPANNYLDDVAGYMYGHNFRDYGYKDEIPEVNGEDGRNTSHDNITVHTLSFAQDLPLLTDTALDGGGTPLAANNSQQMVNALNSLAMLAVQSASYVAPVISVDTANKTQSGEWLYMAFFKPTNHRWVGNLKKYKLAKKDMSFCGDDRKTEWVVTDKTGDAAVDCDGQFFSNSKSYWSNLADGGEVTKGGVGAILKDRVESAFTNNTYYTQRNIYVLKNDGTSIAFKPSNMNNFGGTYFSDENINTAEKYKIINYIYGYTYAVKDATGEDYDPESTREWPLGSFIHSTPKIIEYENEEEGTYIIIGANDGMLHVFDNSSGSEVVAFIPEDILDDLHNINPDKGATDYEKSPLFFVDGETSYYQTFSSSGKAIPKQLIFGLRRGGSSYYSINIENFEPSQWVAKWHISPSGDFAEIGESWSKMELIHYRTGSDIGNRSIAGIFCAGYDNEYDDPDKIVSSNGSKPGAAIYAIDILQSNINTIDLIGKAFYNSASSTDTSKMLYAIPATPAVMPDKYGLLKSVYFADLGGQVWNWQYDNTNYNQFKSARLVFKANPGSNSSSGDLDGGTIVADDIGRKMFYSPTITLMGKCDYRYSETTDCDYTDIYPTETESCGWTSQPSDTPVLIVGTGDRENPNRTDINNRIYMILDTEGNETTPKTFTETDLFNVTMDDLDVDNTEKTDDEKTEMRAYLSTVKGWFIKLEDIDDTDILGSHHNGEKILAHPLVFAGAAYIPSFTPITDDPCQPKGEAKVYALKYCDGTAAVNFYKPNDGTDTDGNKVAKFNYLDRYKSIGESIPSTPKIIIRDGKTEIFVSVGGGLPTIESPDTGKPIEIINWRELRN